MRKSILRGGLYHLALLSVVGLAFNWGFLQLTGVDIAARIVAGMSVSTQAVAIWMCVASLIVLWNNWVD